MVPTSAPRQPHCRSQQAVTKPMASRFRREPVTATTGHRRLPSSETPSHARSVFRNAFQLGVPFRLWQRRDERHGHWRRAHRYGHRKSLRIQPFDGNPLNRSDAPFCPQPGKHRKANSFRSVKHITKYIRHYYGRVYIASDGDGPNSWDTTVPWTDDASFIVSPPWSSADRGRPGHTDQRPIPCSGAGPPPGARRPRHRRRTNSKRDPPALEPHGGSVTHWQPPAPAAPPSGQPAARPCAPAVPPPRAACRAATGR